jgi:hypothetical protein
MPLAIVAPTPAGFIDHASVNVTIAIMGLGWIALAALLGWLMRISLIDAAIPVIIRVLFTFLFVTSLGTLCGVASRKILVTCSTSTTMFSIFRLIIAELFLLDEGAHNVVDVITLRLAPLSALDVLGLSITLLVICKSSSALSGMHLLYAGGVSGIFYGGVTNLIHALEHLASAPELLPFVEWFDGFATMSAYCSIALLMSWFLVRVECGFTENAYSSYFLSVIVPLVLILGLQSTDFLNGRSKDSVWVHAEILAYTIALTMCILCVGPTFKKAGIVTSYQVV